MMGTICERLQPKKGKYWVYIRWGAVPFGLAAVLTYTTPNLSYGLKIVWALVTYNLLNMRRVRTQRLAISLWQVSENFPPNRTYTSRCIRLSRCQSNFPACNLS